MLFILMLLVSALIAYAWFLFPVLLRIAASCRPKSDPRVRPAVEPPPRVSVVFSAYNEEAHIAQRIHNLLEDWPREVSCEIRIGIDASEDNTAGIAERLATTDARLRVHAFATRRGKVSVIKDLVADCTGSILLFTDANTCFRRGAVPALLRHFADPAVGGVCGRLVLVSGALEEAIETDADTQEGFYWRWETVLKTRESRLDSCLGANGAIFAMRRELFWAEIPANTMVDDFVIGMKVREQGYRMLYEPAAVAVEELPDVRDEWVRRVRIGAGDYQALTLCRRCLHPRFGAFAWCFWSHKVLRWFTPHAALVLLLLAPPALVGERPLGRWMGLLCLAGFVLAAVLALLGRALRDSRARGARLPQLVLHFVSMQAALLTGFVRFAFGNLTGHWVRTPRSAGRGGQVKP